VISSLLLLPLINIYTNEAMYVTKKMSSLPFEKPENPLSLIYRNRGLRGFFKGFVPFTVVNLMLVEQQAYHKVIDTNSK
jgi:hypothetical protein